MRNTLAIAVATSLSVYLCPNTWAQDDVKALTAAINSLKSTISEMGELVKKQEERISALEAENRTLRTISSTSSPPVLPNQPTVKGSGAYVPEIGVVADITESLSESKEDEDGNDRLSVREVELVFGHDIDPYSRFDSTITFSDYEDPDIEEAYVSYWDLPFEGKARIGRMRPKVGKASALHRDSLDTIDEPLVVKNYLGAEGLFKTGLEYAVFTPLSGDSFTQQLVAGLIEGGAGEDGHLFGQTRRRPSYYAHLANFLDISDTTNFEIGGTYLLGSKDEDSKNEVKAFGFDVTAIQFFSPLNKLKVQSETYLQNRDESFIQDDSGNRLDTDGSPWGYYVLADYRLSERWGMGGRYDWVEPIDLAPDSQRSQDTAVTGYLTFYQSEFARWRFQYQFAQLAEGVDDNRFFFQGTFAIGTHKHQLQ